MLDVSIVALGILGIRLPKDVKVFAQGFWAAIGISVPVALGACVA